MSVLLTWVNRPVCGLPAVQTTFGLYLAYACCAVVSELQLRRCGHVTFVLLTWVNRTGLLAARTAMRYTWIVRAVQSSQDYSCGDAENGGREFERLLLHLEHLWPLAAVLHWASGWKQII